MVGIYILKWYRFFHLHWENRFSLVVKLRIPTFMLSPIKAQQLALFHAGILLSVCCKSNVFVLMRLQPVAFYFETLSSTCDSNSNQRRRMMHKRTLTFVLHFFYCLRCLSLFRHLLPVKVAIKRVTAVCRRLRIRQSLQRGRLYVWLCN